MSISRRCILSGAASAIMLWTLPRAAVATDWRPRETVRFIIPAAPGGTTDIMGRFLAQHIQVTWGASVVVENKSGGTVQSRWPTLCDRGLTDIQS